MIVYNFNSFNGRYYCYDMDAYDICTDMFDWSKHDTNLTPVMKHTVCGYCGTEFISRSRLFYHLGFMNIDICKPMVLYKPIMNEEAGEEGFVTSKKHARKLLQFHKTIKKNRSRQRLKDLSLTLSKLSINNTKG